MLARTALLAASLFGLLAASSGCAVLTAGHSHYDGCGHGRHESLGGAVVGALVSGAVHALLDDDEPEAEPVVPVRGTPVLGPVTASPTVVGRDGKLRTHTAFHGGYLHAVAKPARSTTLVVLSVRPAARFADAPCEVRLFRDGEPVVIHEVSRAGDHELLVAVESRALRDLDESARFAGELCGRELSLDSVGRETLSLFEIRFRELVHARTQGGPLAVRGE